MPFYNVQRMSKRLAPHHLGQYMVTTGGAVSMPSRGGIPLFPRSSLTPRESIAAPTAVAPVEPISRPELAPRQSRPVFPTPRIIDIQEEPAPSTGPKIAKEPEYYLTPPKFDLLPPLDFDIPGPGPAPPQPPGGGPPSPPPAAGGVRVYQSQDSCGTRYRAPGVASCGCVCMGLDDPNNTAGRLTQMLDRFLTMEHQDRQEVLNYYSHYASQNDDYRRFLEHYKKGMAAYEYAEMYGLCWPLPSEYWLQDGGYYLLGAGRALAAILGVPMLYEMAAEIGASQAVPGTPMWPVAVPHMLGGAYGYPRAPSLHGVLMAANNIIANYLYVSRVYEMVAVKARTSFEVCDSRARGGASTEPLYLGSAGGGCASTPNDFMLYYLVRYPAIDAMIPTNMKGAGASEIANAINTSLSELVAYGRMMREEQRVMVDMLEKCEQGLPTGNAPDSDVVPGLLPSMPILPDGIGPSHLPDPYADYGTMPEVSPDDYPGMPGSDMPLDIIKDDKPTSVTPLLILAALGLAFVSGR